MILRNMSKSRGPWSQMMVVLCEQIRIRDSPHYYCTNRMSSKGRRYSQKSSWSTKDLPPPPPGGVGVGAEGKMRSWQIHSYGPINNDQLLTLAECRVPPIKTPNDVLVKVHAASVNPIDVAMCKGYGADTLNVMRGLCKSVEEGPFPQLPTKSPFFKSTLIEFPLTLGRDFAGTVVQMGHGAKGKHGLRVGDPVFGVVGVQRQGSHAEYVLASVDTIRRKPENLNFVEAASIPYVGLTCWAAIRVTGAFSNLSGKRFLVLGGSGGVGTFALQYLKAQGAHVVTTCSSDAESLMISLGADFVIDYRLQEYDAMIKLNAPYDCVLDLSGSSNAKKSLELTTKHLKPVVGQFITLSPPFLSNMDKFGFLGGALKNVGDLLATNYQSWSRGSAVAKWAFFLPNGDALENFTQLIESQRIRPVLHETFKFEELRGAYKAVEEGRLRGKIVIDMQV